MSPLISARFPHFSEMALARFSQREIAKSLLIPEGFAHGFQTLTDDCELVYLHSASFHPETEGALNVSDPKLAIACHWP